MAPKITNLTACTKQQRRPFPKGNSNLKTKTKMIPKMKCSVKTPDNQSENSGWQTLKRRSLRCRCNMSEEKNLNIFNAENKMNILSTGRLVQLNKLFLSLLFFITKC